MKRDAAEAAIVKGLRDLGASVLLLDSRVKGVPDLLVGFRGVNHLLEVKSKGGRLSDAQQEWMLLWRGRHPDVVFTLDAALVALGLKPPF